MSFTFLLIAAGILIVLIVGCTMFAETGRQHQIDQAATNLLGRAVKKFPNYAGRHAICGDALILVLDEERRTTLVANADGVAKEIPFSKFESIEILEDGHTVAETRKKGVLTRAAVGGALTGGVGAVIGAVSAGSVTTQKEIVTNITVTVSTSDSSFPTLSWCTFAPKFGLEHMTAFEVKAQRENARAFANQFSPIFQPNTAMDDDLVTI